MKPNINEARWIPLQSNKDPRGTLTAVEAGHHTPFEIKRIFYMHDIVSDRGGHAHRDTDQMVIAAYGSFKMDLLDGENVKTFEMNDATKGLYIPRMIFTKLYNFSPGAVALVLASTHYDMSRSLRTWEDYQNTVSALI
jgi:dTDP-4-dehydrorhamnose 3,5-epimerase-like enzyme